MTAFDHRISMTRAEFLAIGQESKSPFNEYYNRFYSGNEKVNSLSIEEFRATASVGLKLLVIISFFDNEVCNGGVTQFLWNCPHLIADVGEALEILGQEELSGNYERVCETLSVKLDQWKSLRDEACRDESNPDWDSFTKSYELLDLDWFDSTYHDEYPKDGPSGEVVKTGLGTQLNTAVLAYLQKHRDDFIIENG